MSEQNLEQEIINRVLFVDDEPNILSSLRRGLAREKYIKFFALNAEEALYIMQEHEIHIIVSDMRMPGMSGLDLLKIVSEKYPNTIKIVLSGYTQLPQVLATINQVDIYKFIPKPWNMEEEFIPLIRVAIDQYNMQAEYRQFRSVLERQNQFYQKMIKQNEDRYNLLKNDYERLSQFQRDLMKFIADLLKTPDFSNLSGADLSAKLLATESLAKVYSSAFPLEASNFTGEKIRTELVQILGSLRPKEKEEDDGLPFIGKKPVLKEAEFQFPIKNDGFSAYLQGHYKLYLVIQKMILVRLLQFRTPEELTISQVYDERNHSFITQYECPMALLNSSKWDFQMALFIIKYANMALPGKLDIQKNEPNIKISSIFQCKLKD